MAQQTLFIEGLLKSFQEPVYKNASYKSVPTVPALLFIRRNGTIDQKKSIMRIIHMVNCGMEFKVVRSVNHDIGIVVYTEKSICLNC